MCGAGPFHGVSRRDTKWSVSVIQGRTGEEVQKEEKKRGEKGQPRTERRLGDMGVVIVWVTVLRESADNPGIGEFMCACVGHALLVCGIFLP